MSPGSDPADAPSVLSAPAAPAAPAALALDGPGVPACLNCGAEVAQRFCPACGQETGHGLQRPLRRIVGELLDETLALDARFARTVGPLFRRPGFLTAEHLAGRRARYTSPLKLYLLFSFLFFVAAALSPGESLRVKRAAEPAETLEARQATEAGLAEVRALGPLAARLADRVVQLQALPPAELQARATAAIQQNAPRVMFFLVPVLALLLKLAWPRRYYAEHLVASLHAHAVGFAVLLPGQVAGLAPLAQVGVLAGVAWLLLALRRIHGQGWLLTVVKGLTALIAYAMALGISLALALAAGLLLG